MFRTRDADGRVALARATIHAHNSGRTTNSDAFTQFRQLPSNFFSTVPFPLSPGEGLIATISPARFSEDSSETRFRSRAPPPPTRVYKRYFYVSSALIFIGFTSDDGALFARRACKNKRICRAKLALCARFRSPVVVS